MNLTAEYMGANSECQFFRTIKDTHLESEIERSVYNRRRRFLFPYLEQVRKKMADAFNEYEDIFIIDSIPLGVYKNARVSRNKTYKEESFSLPDKGFCASQQMYYYGYKLHGI